MVEHGSIPDGADAGRGRSVQEILRTDSREVPATLLTTSMADLPESEVTIDRYLDPGYHEREIERVWRRTWQVACRAEDIPEPGDRIAYDINDDSVVVVRGDDDEIRAFWNSCLHRGTLLCEGSDQGDRFRCPFHGMRWKLDGTLEAMPSEWDFPHVDRSRFDLPQVRTGVWGGFVFVCLDPDTEPLEDYLEVLPEQFRDWPLEQRHKAVHVAKVVDCNWKVAIEAFIEAYHIAATHPQSLSYFGDEVSQYDTWPGVRHVSRVISNAGMPSPHLTTDVDDDTVVRDFQRDVAPARTTEPYDGTAPRRFLAEAVRSSLAASAGTDLSAVSDTELLDTIQYLVFPNVAPWAGIGAPIVYRWRPYGNDPNRCLFEVMLLFVVPPSEARRRGADIHWLGDDETFADAPELGELGKVLDQDLANLPRIQRGLRTSRKPAVTLSRYQESRLRHFHHTLDAYLAED